MSNTLHSFEIDGRKIGPDAPPYVIAEMSGNHNGDITRAFAIMDAAKAAGADALKMQTYTADTITIDHDGDEFRIDGGLWAGKTLYELYGEAHTPWAWHEKLFDHGRKIGLTVFSAPFDSTAVDLLESLDAPAYKIASFEAIDLPLIARVAQTGKPMIISTGMANQDEIGEAVAAARAAGAENLALLHCVSGYPAPVADSNLRVIPDLADRFDVLPGLSDHTPGTAVSVAAIALGARIIEKHVTLRRSDGGPDAAFSLEPEELAELCTATRAAFEALGSVDYTLKSSEKDNTIFRRSLYVVADIKAGETFSTENLRSIRPGFGLAPKHLPSILGQVATRDISRGSALSLDMVKTTL